VKNQFKLTKDTNTTLRLLSLVTFILVSCGNLVDAQNISEVLFKNPPTAYKPKTWMHAMSGNMSKEGLTKDLEAGDERYPANDGNYNIDLVGNGNFTTKVMPDWYVQNQPRPSGQRQTFTTASFYKATDALQSSGLLQGFPIKRCSAPHYW
jgi:hypothetical protein